MSKLVIFRGDAVENEIHLGGNTLRIGRDARNDIVLDDKSVTRFHAEVRAEGSTYYIVDLKSRNGVWMNGQQIKGKAALPLGVTVTVGAYELALEDDVSTGDLGEAPLANRTAVSPAADRSNRPSSRSATQRMSTPSPASAARKPALFWSGLVVRDAARLRGDLRRHPLHAPAGERGGRGQHPACPARAGAAAAGATRRSDAGKRSSGTWRRPARRSTAATTPPLCVITCRPSWSSIRPTRRRSI